MASEEPQGGPEGLNEDELVRKLVPDPSRPAQPTAVLAGLLGRSVREGYWRLYLTSTLSEYAEFKEEDLVHSEKIPQDQLPLVGVEATRVWLRQGAEVEYTRTESRRVQAEFLSGNIAAAGLVGAAGRFGAAEALQRPGVGTRITQPRVWQSEVDFCPSALGCTMRDACASIPGCTNVACPTQAYGCNVSLRPCPSWADNCPTGFCPTLSWRTCPAF